MIRNYITQAFTMMRQHKLFTAIYIAGTAISLALAMTLFMVLYIHLAPSYPEYHRNRTMKLWGFVIKDIEPRETEMMIKYLSGGIRMSKEFATETICDIDGIEQIALTNPSSQTTIRAKETGILKKMDSGLSNVDHNYWKMFDFEFIHGTPFTKEELHDAKVVISESLAKELFARTDVVGKTIIIDDKEECTITGVVKDAPRCMAFTCYDLFFPLHYHILYARPADETGYGGNYHALIKCSLGADMEDIKKEIDNRYSRYSQEFMQNDGIEKYKYEMEINENWQEAFLGLHENIWDCIKKFLYVIMAFLFIPALNLSGMISSRMNSRLAEIGVRKAYGATNAQILWQLLCENLLLTLIGSIVGLVLSYIIVNSLYTYLTSIITRYAAHYDTPMHMLFSTEIFIVTLLLCVLLNIASALLPALFALRKNIVQSLYDKR